jgi:hypothetical protein
MSNFRVDTSAQGAIPVTPSDTVNITFPSGVTFSKGVYVGTSGDLSVVMADGTTATYKAATGLLPLAVVRVNATGTTAGDIVAVY